MMKEIVTAIPPEELGEIAEKSGARVSLTVEKAEPFHGMPRYRVRIEGAEEEVERFMEQIRLARAGG